MGTAQLFRTWHHHSWLKACTDPVGKALWFIESLFTSDLTLEDVAVIGGVPPDRMAREFEEATGMPLMRYVAGRRLTEAARLLANGAPDVSRVAQEYGYPTPALFSRAFRDQFGVAPETVQRQGHLDGLELVEPARLARHRVVFRRR